MRREVVVGMSCAMVLVGVVTASARGERELSADRARWSKGLLAACPDFAVVYGRSADGFLRTLKQRVDCVLSLTYVHSAATCLAQVCGNGIPEADEACDDGNADDADGCRSDCTRTDTAAPTSRFRPTVTTRRSCRCSRNEPFTHSLNSPIAGPHHT